MPTFAYKARTRRGKVMEDTVEGENQMAVAANLCQQGLLVIDVKEQGVGQKDILEPFKRVKLTDLVISTRQFATMINAGLPIVRALYVLSEQTSNPKLKDGLIQVRKDVEADFALSEALVKHPKVFNRLYVEMVRAGEIGGILDNVLLRVASQLEKDQELRRKVKSAMTYPLVVLVLAILAAAFMLIFIVPIFARMFEDLGGTLPLPTRIAMGLSQILAGPGGLLVAAALIGGVIFFLRWIKTDPGRKAWGRAVLKLPVTIGDIVQKVALARLLRPYSGHALRGRRAHPTLSGDHGQLRRKLGYRERAPQEPGLHPRGIADLQAARKRARVPADGDAHDRGRRGDRRPGRHARQDRRILRVRGGRRGEVSDLDHRAADDRGRRRYSRRHHHRHVPSDVQDLRVGRVTVEPLLGAFGPPVEVGSRLVHRVGGAHELAAIESGAADDVGSDRSSDDQGHYD